MEKIEKVMRELFEEKGFPNVQIDENNVVDFETAKILKEQGFDRPTNHWYTLFHKKLIYSKESNNWNTFKVTKEAIFYSSAYSAPSLTQFYSWIKRNTYEK